MGTTCFLSYHWLFIFEETAIVLKVLGILVSPDSKVKLYFGGICNKHHILKFGTLLFKMKMNFKKN